jgi:uncharacterized protein YeaO (DUF488 family)
MLYTAQMSYTGPDRFDITVKSNGIFSPTWDMVQDYKKTGDESAYIKLYKAKMQQSYRDNTWKWKEMVDMCTRADVTLVCFCKPGDFCHRRLLAEYLIKCGAKYMGERSWK